MAVSEGVRLTQDVAQALGTLGALVPVKKHEWDPPPEGVAQLGPDRLAQLWEDFRFAHSQAKRLITNPVPGEGIASLWLRVVADTATDLNRELRLTKAKGTLLHVLAYHPTHDDRTKALAKCFNSLRGYLSIAGGVCVKWMIDRATSIDSPFDDRQPAIAELRQLAERCEAKEKASPNSPLLRIQDGVHSYGDTAEEYRQYQSLGEFQELIGERVEWAIDDLETSDEWRANVNNAYSIAGDLSRNHQWGRQAFSSACDKWLQFNPESGLPSPFNAPNPLCRTARWALVFADWLTMTAAAIREESPQTGADRSPLVDLQANGMSATEPEPATTAEANDAPAAEIVTKEPQRTEAQIVATLKPAVRLVWASWCEAEKHFDKTPKDREAWDWIRESDLPEPQAFGTWTRHLGTARKALGRQKNTPRAGRESRSVVKANQL